MAPDLARACPPPLRAYAPLRVHGCRNTNAWAPPGHGRIGHRRGGGVETRAELA